MNAFHDRARSGRYWTSRRHDVQPAPQTFTHVREVMSSVARRSNLKVTDLRPERGKAFADHPHRDAIVEVVRIAVAARFPKKDIREALHASASFLRSVERQWLQ